MIVLKAGLGITTILPCMDFETFSPAGFEWNAQTQKWGCLPGAAKKGLRTVGTVRYTEHPDAEILSLAYDLKKGAGAKLWCPGEPLPLDLFNYLNNGGIIEAWNSIFEYFVWNNIGVRKYSFPPLLSTQLRCAMAKARAHALPGKLELTADVLNLTNKKDKDGTRLLEKFSKPRNPTKNNPELRNRLSRNDRDSEALYNYNLKDIAAESEASLLIPDLNEHEQVFWQCDQLINIRGVRIDLPVLQSAISIIEQAYVKYNTELNYLTNGQVKTAAKVPHLKKWLAQQGVFAHTLTANKVEELLNTPTLPDLARRVLLIREMLSAAAVKKLYAMANQVSSKQRLHNLFVYHSARTGRAAGAGPQPQNLPNSGPAIRECSQCLKHFDLPNEKHCPWCGGAELKKVEWNAHAVKDAISLIKTKSLACVEYYYENPLQLISGCLRGLFIASEGCDLICSDYSAIEAVVLAVLAGEQWRIDVFRTHGKIYEMSASKITGISFKEFEQYEQIHKQHHPLRKKVGKVAELASGYQGWIGAWKQFGASEFFSEDEIKKAVLAWRSSSPMIVEMWGGQEKNKRPYFYGLEGMAIMSVMRPGQPYDYRGITYLTENDILYCRLLSGRYITYHKPRIAPSSRGLSLSFEGWNTNPKNGGIGWVRMGTYGGKLTENVVQATARDILTHAIVNLEKAGYKIVLHVHDEIVAEVPERFGSLEEFESIMNTMPPWASDWPIKAQGGWRAKRYQK